MKPFHLETSDKEVIAEGIVFSNGSVSLSWLTERPGGAFYSDLFELEKRHRDLNVIFKDKDTEYETLSNKSIFEIGRAENGWIVREYESDTVIVADECELDSEHQAFAGLLWSLVSQFGPSDSKYSAERIMVSVIPGADCESAKLEPAVVRDKVLDHLDYCLRFLHNVDPQKKTEDLEILEKQLDTVFENLISKVFAKIEP